MNAHLREFLRFPPLRKVGVMVLRTLAFSYLGLVLFAATATNKLLFHPPGHRSDLRGQVKLKTADGNEITGLYLPNPSAAYVLLFSYGNGEDLVSDRDFLQDLLGHGWAVMGYDYPGYGTSTGQPGEAGCDAALDAAYAYLTNEKHLPAERIVLYGRSLGSGPAVDLASRKPIGGLILQSAYTSIFRVVTHYRILPWDKFNNFAKISAVHATLLSIHGTDDQVVPFWHGEALYDAYPGPKQHLWVPGADHNNLIEMAGQTFWTALDSYRQSLPLSGPINSGSSPK